MKNTLHLLKKITPMLALAVLMMGSGIAWAAQGDVAYTLDLKYTASNGAKGANYTAAWDWVSNSKTWSLNGAANNNGGWAYVRFGGKSNTSGLSYAAAKSTISLPIEKVTMNVLALGGKEIASNAFTLIVASNSNFTTIIDQVSKDKATGAINFTPSVGANWPANSYFKLTIAWNNSTGSNIGTDVTTVVFYEGSSTPIPAITLSPTSLNGFNYISGNGPSTEQTFTVSGSNLTADISIAASTNYEISKTIGSGYTTPLTYTQTGGAVAATTVYVRLKAGLVVGTYDNEAITATSAGATDKTVTCSGSVTAPPPPDAPVATTATATTATGFTANWNTVSGATEYFLDVYHSGGNATASDLIISEYIEGSGNNKAIEIYNGTGSSVNLADYSLKKQSNGTGVFGSELVLSGTLSNDDTYVIVLNTAGVELKAYADLVSNSGCLTFNGNDAVALYKSGTQIDVVGIVDETDMWGDNVTLVRKSSVTGPTISYSISDWDSYDIDEFGYLGSHTMGAGTTYDLTNQSVGNVTSYAVSDLTSGTTYNYVVRAANTYGSSVNSNEIEVTTTGTANVAPVITNIVQTPASGINSSTTISVSADVTDTDGTVEGVELHWGTVSGTLTNNIVMSLASGNTYTTVSDIPVQSNGVTVFYEIYALDDDAAEATSTEQSYTVTDPVIEPTNHPTAFIATASSSSTIIVMWDDAIPAAAGYLIKGSATSYEAIVAPVDGTPESDALLVQNISAGDEIHEFTGLSASTQYFFKIYPYNGSGAEINYKTDGNVPETSATTEAPPSYDYVETFDNFDETGTSYVTGTFLGQDGSTWNYVQSRGDVEITGSALMIGRNRTPQSEAYSGTIGGGIQILNFDYMQAFATNVNLNVLVNDVVVGNVTSLSEQDVVKNSGDIVVNVSGDFVLKFINVNNSDGQVVIDNISWVSVSAFTTYTGTGNWDVAGNWSKGIPDASTNAIINGNVTVNDAAECNNLTISSLGAVTVGAGKELYIYGDLLIQSNTTGTGSFIGDGTSYVIGGTSSVQRYITGASEAWHLLSSPVDAQSISGVFTPAGTYGDGTGYDFYAWDEPNATWLNKKDLANGITTFNPGQGYLVAYQSPNTKIFTGNLNNGNVASTLKYEASGDYKGSNLIGNPYASGIDWNVADRTSFADNFAYLYNAAKDGGEGYINVDGNSANAYIGISQGFMVLAKSDQNNATFNFTNAMRAHGGSFLKNTNAVDQLQVRFANAANYDETTIRLSNESDFIRDRNDAVKMFSYNSSIPQVYTLTSDLVKTSINTIPTISEEAIFALSLYVPGEDNYVISLPVVEGEFAGRTIYLEDKLTGSIINLSESQTYAFAATPSDDVNRFLLTFNSTVGIHNPDAANAIQVYSNGEVFYVATSTKESALVNVYNLTGQLVMQGKTGGNSLSTFNASALSNGVYVINVIHSQGVVSQKVVIRK